MDALWTGLGIGFAVGLPIFLMMAGLALINWSE